MENKLSSFESQLERLKSATGTSSDTALGRVLGLSQGSISGAKGRKRIPSEWIKQIAVKFSVSSDWLFFGEGSMTRGSYQSEPAGQAPGCAQLQEELASERSVSRELMTENRELSVENRALWKENADLRVELAKLKARAAPDDEESPEAARDCA